MWGRLLHLLAIVCSGFPLLYPSPAIAQDMDGAGSLRTCTLIGCRDRFTIAIARSDGRKLERFPDLFLTIDGRKVSCVDIPQSDLGEVDGSACGENVDVRLATVELHNCEGSEPAGCVPADRYETRIYIFGTPKAVSATVQYRPKLAETRVFTPHYTSSYPNGRDCDPPCTKAREAWVLKES
jgi:hypothetical protein